jgi:DNA modification methylase
MIACAREKWRRRTAKREFISKIEAIQPSKELLFDSTSNRGKYDRYLSHAKNPAKMNRKLIELLVSRYTKRDEVVLDVMAGASSSGVVASQLGRHSVNVELELEFVRWADLASLKIAQEGTLDETGFIINIHGDARQTSHYLERVDFVLTSPPYLDQNRYSKIDKRVKQLAESKTTGVGKQVAEGKYRIHYSSSKKNIGNFNSKKYFKAMFKVYEECFKVLKKGGLAAIVVRPLTRNKSVLDLPYQTWLILQKVGFRLVDLYTMEIPRSLWTNMYEKHYPLVAKIRKDYIIVVRKPHTVASL